MDFFKLDRAVLDFFRYADSYTFFISTLGLYLVSTIGDKYSSNFKRGNKNVNRNSYK